MKKLTIITINFNHREGLKRTIDSIVNQTYTDYEWIVVDGGSTDGSKELLELYKDRFAWWCSEPDKGVYNAMNKGISHATGEYINFMNSGDVFASNTILDEVFSMPHEANILYGLMMEGDINGEVNNLEMMKSHINWWDFYHYNFGHQSVFTNRTLFEDYGLFDESYHIMADRKLFATLVAIHKVSHEYLPLKISIYEGNGISVNEHLRIENELLRIRREIYPTLSSDDISELMYIGRAKQYWLSNKLLYILLHTTNWIRKKFLK